MLDTYMSTSALLLKAWQSGKSHIRASLIAVAILFALALGVGLLSETGILDKRIAGVVVVVLGAVSGVLALGVVAYQSLEEQRAREQKA